MPTDTTLPPLDPFAGVPDKRYEVKAADLLKPGSSGILRWRRQATNAPIVLVEDAYITGTLDLRAADLNFLFQFERCRFEHPPDVREATLLGLVFRKCWLPGLRARNLRSRNDVRLIRSTVEIAADEFELETTTVQRGDDRERGMPNAAVNLTDAVIDGSVVLTRTTISHPHGKAIQGDRLVITGALLAYRMVAKGEVRLPGMRTGGNVNFSGATFDNPDGFAFNGNGLHIGGSLLCEVDNYGPASERKRFSAKGVLYLPSATVDSDIVMREARLQVDQRGPIVVDAWKSGDPYLDPRPALVADRLKVDGNLELSDGLRAFGTLRMVNARIGGSLRLAGAEITMVRGRATPYYDRALHLDGSTIGGDIEATNLRVPIGQLRLADVTVGGNFLAWNSMFLHPGRDVFSARRAKISGNFQLTDATLQGTLRLQGAEVGGSVNMFGTLLTEPGQRKSSSFSLDIRTARIGRDLVLTEDKDRPFLAEGGVNLDGAQIARRLDMNGAKLGSLAPHDIALDASDVTADEFILSPAEAPTGSVRLRRAHCGALADNEEIWNATDGLELEDFRYDALKHGIALDDDKALDHRIELLRKAMRGYRPGPYDQLAATLRAAGNEEHASTVALRKQQFRYEALAKGFKFFGPGVRVWSWLQRSMVGYGFRPVRALGWLFTLLVLGSLWFGLGKDDCVNDHTGRYMTSGPRCLVNQQDSGLQWNPVIYTADLLVPIVDFGNKSRWYMHGADNWVAAGFTASGWILATTVAAGVSRMLRRES
ncbi:MULTISPECIES: oxidoreductase [Amycolatopsis]|uniref:Oxidoreductase n=1 Tax=Amycolatopsis dendrobii TaxID=2760662 RepID=A0A7W3ZCI7_9PSEU|nr:MULTISPECIES: oxidoreductase [Amycolatopsis]MBB1155923.1 oxidoreductase [Amycolatopsis dendrobii]UKD53120.1 oxidoreductase [Amycolatopsis sp. FU40]